MNATIEWKQNEVNVSLLADFLSERNLHPGYFHILEGHKPSVKVVVWLELPDKEG